METHKINIIGIDVGGSHITVAPVCPNTYRVNQELAVRKKINPHAPADEILNDWAAAVQLVYANLENPGRTCLAFAMPGPFDYTNGISLIKGMNKYEALYAYSIRDFFAQTFAIPTEDIVFANDAAAFLKGEVVAGAGEGYQRVFGITLGTGLGSACCIDGESRDLNLGSSSFLDGIAEDYMSTRGMVAYYEEKGGTTANNVQQMIQELGDPDHPSAQVMAQMSTWLTQFLLKPISELYPEIIVIGGNIAQAHVHFLPKVIQSLKEKGIEVPIKIAEMGEYSAIAGAASWLTSSRR